ncbi:MAG: cytochrome b5 domain-containing protein [Candidatus Roizmanbacteria bacterium]|nr:cytochrome b5 domain-containing protein [Candidatus Roizmanbacteria bacterium]
MNKSILISGIAVLVLVGMYIFLRPSKKAEVEKGGISPTKTMSATTTPSASESGTMMETNVKKTFTIAEVKKHSTTEDCYLAIEGKIYDVTKFIESNKHPGGEAIVQGCGTDATKLFNTRPMGSGTPHSDKARDFLPSFYIGDLAK